MRNGMLNRMYVKYNFQPSPILIRSKQGSMNSSNIKIPLRSILLLLLLAFFVDGLKHSKKATQITHDSHQSQHPSPKTKDKTQHKGMLQKIERDTLTRDEEDEKQNKKSQVGSQMEQGKKNKNKGQSEEVESEEEKQKDEESEDQEQEEDQNKSQTQDSQQKTVHPAKSNKKQSSKSQHFQKQSQNNKLNDHQNSKRSYLFYFAIYAFLLIAISFIIKIKAQQSFAAALIDRFLDLTWYGIVKNYFNKSQGYDAPSYDEDDQNNEHIDHGDSVTIGYSQNQGRDLFWEKNSVEGI